jgi:flagella basal body P-ring formation protein FlgA
LFVTFFFLVKFSIFVIISTTEKSARENYRMMSRCTAFALLAVGCLAGSRSPAAGEVQSTAAIRAAVREAIAPRLTAIRDAAVEIEVGSVDPRLQLPTCSSLNVILPPTNAAAMTARVECDTPSWAIYVPVRLHAWVDAVVAAATLTPNTKLAANQLSRGRVDMFSSANGGVVTELAQAEGKILRIGLLAGAPILSPFLEMPIVVHRGQKVLLTLSDNAMIIEAMAVALEDGRIGDTIAVENPDSKKTMRATVAKDGSVEMNFE